jgi:hypothetical protein
MPIEATCLDWIGKMIFVFPEHGYGWQKINTTATPPYPYTPGIQVPPPFVVRLKEFIYEDNQIAGAFGIIEQPNHEFNGFWAAFFARAGGVLLNFTTNVGLYNILITPDKPRITVKPGLRVMHPESIIADGIPRLRGYAEIALSEEFIRRKKNV